MQGRMFLFDSYNSCYAIGENWMYETVKGDGGGK